MPIRMPKFKDRSYQVLVGMWRNLNSHAFLVGMKEVTIILEKSLSVS